MTGRFRYRHWSPDLDAQPDASAALEALSDDVLSHGDLRAAMRRMMRDGLDMSNDRLEGIRELLDRLRAAQQARQDNADDSSGDNNGDNNGDNDSDNDGAAGDAPADNTSGSQADQLDALDTRLRSLSSPFDITADDVQRIEQFLGAEAAAALTAWMQLADELVASGLVDSSGETLDLTPEAMRRIGRRALAEVFRRLSSGALGAHDTAKAGVGHERTGVSLPWDGEQDLNLDLIATVTSAIRREGRGVPVKLSVDDFMVAETELQQRTATVVLLDLSLSMPMRNRFLAAKKTAVALHELVRTTFPRDRLAFVGFGLVAREIPAANLASVSWDLDYGTNLQHALALARRILGSERGTKQVLVVTDGEPTAYVPAGSDVPIFRYPPTQDVFDATLGEVVRCTKDRIRINTFMLEPDESMRAFVTQMTQINGGRAFFSDPEHLGEFVLVDFLRSR